MKQINEICLIEDEPIPTFLAKKFIEKTGMVNLITEYHNGKEAYDALKLRCENGESLPDFIFLDINMPIWDGWEFYEEFQKLPGNEAVKTYILTSTLSDDDLQNAKEYGLMDRYLSKPLNFDKLKAIFEFD